MSAQVPEPSLRRWRYLVDVGLWPRMVEFNWRGWLQNFEDDEMPFAVRLLDSFLYFSQPITRQLFRTAFLSASERVIAKQALPAAQAQWRSYVENLLVVRVIGERPSAADSGYAFSRLARDDLDVAEDQLFEPAEAIGRLLRDRTGDIMFVDDFVGSGTQFNKLWQRRFDVPGQGRLLSFADVAKQHPDRFRYFLCTAVATEYGLGNIRDMAPMVVPLNGQTLDGRASATATPSLIWRDDMAEQGPAFIRRASERAGIPLEEGVEHEWNGFHGLGLTVAFAQGWPDATLPLFHWSRNGWIPLLSKGAV
ncbi:phosphoribosyltransferase-like protein [Acidovorax sp.]|uniref:phosphoribosyltransferase-like protein n=1 Tax=Acidovorax sp. TaxID=1872122 RepID=UPI00403819E5